VGALVKFPHDKVVRDIGRHKVFVTFVMDWEGINGEHAANDAANALSAVAADVAEFYDEAQLVWGEYREGKAPGGA
jgi:hypothetical protein